MNLGCWRGLSKDARWRENEEEERGGRRRDIKEREMNVRLGGRNALSPIREVNTAPLGCLPNI